MYKFLLVIGYEEFLCKTIVEGTYTFLPSKFIMLVTVLKHTFEWEKVRFDNTKS